MFFKNTRSLLLIFLISSQSVCLRASENNQKRPETLSGSSTLVKISVVALGFFIGYKLGKFIREEREKNNLSHSIDIPDNVHTITIQSFNFFDCPITIEGKESDSNNKKIKMKYNSTISQVSDGILTINNSNASNIFTVPSEKMIVASTWCGNVTVNNVDCVLVKNCGSGNIGLYDIRCGIFGHTNSGNIHVIDSKMHNNMRIVNVSTSAGSIYFKIHSNNSRKQKLRAIFQRFGIVSTAIIGTVVIGSGNLIIEEV